MERYSKLYKCRTLGEKFSQTVYFLKDSWKPLLCVLSAVVVPVCLLQSFCSEDFMDSLPSVASKDAVVRFAFGMAWRTVMMFIADIYVMIAVYSAMKVYYRHGDSKMSESTNRVTSRLIVSEMCGQKGAVINSVGSLVMLVSISLLMVFAAGMALGGLTAALNGNGGMLMALGCALSTVLVVLLPFWILAIPAYCLGNMGFIEGLRTALGYGFSSWCGVVVILVAYFVLNVAVTMPLGLLPSMLGTFCSSFMSYIVQAAALVTLGYQYAHCRMVNCG